MHHYQRERNKHKIFFFSQSYYNKVFRFMDKSLKYRKMSLKVFLHFFWLLFLVALGCPKTYYLRSM